MMRLLMRATGVGIAGVMAAALTLAVLADEKDDGFKPIFNGKDMTGLKLVGTAENTWSVSDKTIHCTGKPNGYFATDKSYKNYVIRFEWKYTRPEGLKDDGDFKGNSGCLVHITGEDKVWPQCIEVQGANKSHADIFAINGSKFTSKRPAADRQAARKKAIKPVGEWNTTEITCQDDKITAKVNGELIDDGDGASPAGGRIGFQSEGAEIHFRNLRIKEL